MAFGMKGNLSVTKNPLFEMILKGTGIGETAESLKPVLRKNVDDSFNKVVKEGSADNLKDAAKVVGGYEKEVSGMSGIDDLLDGENATSNAKKAWHTKDKDGVETLYGDSENNIRRLVEDNRDSYMDKNFGTAEKPGRFRDAVKSHAKVNGIMNTAGELGSAYYKPGGEWSGKRIAGTAAAYMGVNAVGRLASGGSLTRNNQGERDIAGVPFL